MEQTDSKCPAYSFEYRDVRVSIKEFAYTFLKYDVLCYKSSASDQSEVFKRISRDFQIPVNKVPQWVTHFRIEFYQWMLHIATYKTPYEKLATQPKWVQDVEAKLNWLPGAILQVKFKRAKPSEINPDSLLRLLVAFSKRLRNLCAAALYTDIRRSLRFGCTTAEVHTMWVYAQSVSLQLVQSHIRRGDLPSPKLPVSDTNWLVADLVILFTDVEVLRLVTNESLAVLEEYKTLTLLLQLVYNYGVEKANTKAERASKWTQVYNEYIKEGRKTSMVVLQRRWHELKMQARMRFCELKNNTPDGRLPELIHMELAKKFPTVLTAVLTTWAWQVAHGELFLEPIKEVENKKIIENEKAMPELEDKSADDDDDDDDVLLIEKPVEVIAVDTDDENTDTDDDCIIKNSPEISTDNVKRTSTTELQIPDNTDESRLESVEDCKNIEIEIFLDNSSSVANNINENVISTNLAHTSTIPPKEYRPPDSIVKREDLALYEIPCNVKLEKESEPSDTINNAESIPVLDKLQLLDPNRLKVQIIFESDSDENTELVKTDQSESSAKEDEASADEKNNKLNNLPRSTFHQRLRFDEEKDAEDKCEAKYNTSQVDSKLLMATKVELVRLHDTVCWNKYSTNRKYIKVAEINLGELQTAGDRAKYLADIREERRRVALAGVLLDKNRTSRAPGDDIIDIDARRRPKASRISKANQITRYSKKFVNRPFMSDSSTDEEMPLSAIYRPLERAAAWKRKAADAEGSPADNAYPPRKSKRVELHDIEEVRRTNQNLLTAEVAPISAKRNIRNSSSIDFDDVIEDSLQAPKARDLDHNRISRKDLKTVMEKLPAVNMNRMWSETVGDSDYCCLARRDHCVNDTRRRISINLPVINLHVHYMSECNCCCAHLLDEDKNKEKLLLEMNNLDDIMQKVLKLRLALAQGKSQQNDKPDKGASKSREKIIEMRSRNAEKCQNYRNRIKDAALKIKKTSLTPAQRSRIYRLRKNQLAQGVESANKVVYPPSTSNSRMTCEPSVQSVTTGKSIAKPKQKKAQTAPPLLEEFESDISIDEWEKLKRLNEPYFKINNNRSKNQRKKLFEKKEDDKSDPILRDTVTQTTDTVIQTSDTVIQTSDTVTQTSDTVTQTIDMVTQSSDTVTQTSDMVTKSSDTVTQTSDTVTQTSDTVTQTSDTVTQTSDTVANEVTVQETTRQVKAQDVPNKNCGFLICEHKPEDTTVSPTLNACANSPSTTGAQPNVKKYTVVKQKTYVVSEDNDGKSNFMHVLTKSADLLSCMEVKEHLSPADTPRPQNVFNLSKCINLNGDTQVMVTNKETKKIINLLFFNGKMIPIEKKFGEMADKPAVAPNPESVDLLPKLNDKSLKYMKSESDLDHDVSGPYLYRSQAPKMTLDMLISLCAPSLPIVLRSDAARPLLKLPGGYVIIAEGILPCIAPTYWTLAPYRNVARIFLNNNKNIDSSVKFFGKELLEINDKESYNSKLMNNASNAAPTEKSDTDELETKNDIIVLDSDSNDENDAHTHLHNANSTDVGISHLKPEEQQDFTNFIKITDVVGGVRDFTDMEEKAKSELTVPNAETKCDLNNKVQQTTSVLSPKLEDKIGLSNVACNVGKNQSDCSDYNDSVSATQSTVSVNNSSLFKETDIIEREVNDDKGGQQNIMSSTNDEEVITIDSASSASNDSEVLPTASTVEINNAVDDDDDDDSDDRLIINESYSDSTSHNKSDDSNIRSSDASNNDVQLNDTPEITQTSRVGSGTKDELTEDDNKLVKDNCILKDLTSEVGNENKDISTKRSDKASCADAKGRSSEQLLANQADTLKIFTALSECENFREIVAAAKELYLMRRFCGTITPILRVQRDGTEGIASSVPKETLIVLARLLNGNIEAKSESRIGATFPVIDITED